jgi:hypothetical protein
MDPEFLHRNIILPFRRPYAKLEAVGDLAISVK